MDPTAAADDVASGNLARTELVGSSGAGAKYKLMSPAMLPISRSACITIPPGLSPTSFLESPVLLSNVKAEPSPTTGFFSKPQRVHGSSGPDTVFSNANNSDDRKSSYFEFNPHARANMVPSDLNHQRSEKPAAVNYHRHQPQPFGPSSSDRSAMDVSSNESHLSAPNNMVTSGTNCFPGIEVDEYNQTGQTKALVQSLYSDDKSGGVSTVAERLSDDGYNWRKYGQKQVKGSEFPRSYYKCTHPNCEVKKLFERSPDGRITEIIYKGTHDHPKPQFNRRYPSDASVTIQEEKVELSSSLSGQDGKSSGQYGQVSRAIGPHGALEPSAFAVNYDNNLEVTGSLTNRNDDEMDDDDQLKRRKMDVCGFDVTPVVKPLREPRVVVQTLSEVDILDDGYRWRKYGQKVVRGNPNPRSYYKCTNTGCPVRKHVERASHDPKAVITTYEGKHNHDVPTAKSSSHDTAGPAVVGGPSRFRSEESDDISLDLGVGISPGADNRCNDYKLRQHSDLLESQGQNGGTALEVVQATPVSAYFGFPNRGINQFGSRESMSEDNSMVVASLTHPSYQYPQNMGRVLTGP